MFSFLWVDVVMIPMGIFGGPTIWVVVSDIFNRLVAVVSSRFNLFIFLILVLIHRRIAILTLQLVLLVPLVRIIDAHRLVWR